MSVYLSYALLVNGSSNKLKPGFVLENYSAKFTDFTSSSWRKHAFNKPFASFHAKRVLAIFKLLWSPIKNKKQLKIFCIPTKRSHFTLSRGALVRKKQSKNTFTTRMSGWTISCKNKLYLYSLKSAADLLNNPLKMLRYVYVFNKIDNLIDSNVTPIQVSKFEISSHLLKSFRVLKWFAFTRISDLFL